MATPSQGYEVVIRWRPEDVQHLCPYLDLEEATDLLMDLEKHFTDRTIENGWGILEDLMAFHGYAVDPKYEEDYP